MLVGCVAWEINIISWAVDHRSWCVCVSKCVSVQGHVGCARRTTKTWTRRNRLKGNWNYYYCYSFRSSWYPEHQTTQQFLWSQIFGIFIVSCAFKTFFFSFIICLLNSQKCFFSWKYFFLPCTCKLMILDNRARSHEIACWVCIRTRFICCINQTSRRY